MNIHCSVVRVYAAWTEEARYHPTGAGRAQVLASHSVRHSCEFCEAQVSQQGRLMLPFIRHLQHRFLA